MSTYHLSAKIGKKGKGKPHSDYIERVGKNKAHDDLEHVENGNLPEWANGKSGTFWKAADELERANGSVYREIEIALPRELNPAQRLDLVHEFIEQEIGEKHAYSFAIHCPKAALEGGDQPHAHIMYSERMRDGVERSRDQYFKRFNAKKPESGGLKKASGGKHMMAMKEQLKEQRKRWADLQNKHLAMHGHHSTVDHRTLEQQGIKRDPNKHKPHLGPEAVAIKKKGQESTRLKLIKNRTKEVFMLEYEANKKRIASKAAEQTINTKPIQSNGQTERSVSDRISDSLTALIDWVTSRKGKLRSLNVENALSVGKIEAVNADHALQHLGRNTYAIHELKRMSEPVKAGDSATIKYKNGVASVTVKSFGLGKDLGR